VLSAALDGSCREGEDAAECSGFVKRQKNDAADAEAIVVAAQRPEMRFVPPKSEDQLACAVLFRARERLLHQRTELVNALRSVL